MEENAFPNLDNFNEFLPQNEMANLITNNDGKEIAKIDLKTCIVLEHILLKIIKINEKISIQFQGMTWNFCKSISTIFNLHGKDISGFRFMNMKNAASAGYDTMDLMKSNETLEEHWNTFNNIMEKLVSFTESKDPKKALETYINSLPEKIEYELRCYVYIHSSVYKPDVTSIKMFENELKITVGSFPKIWVINMDWDKAETGSKTIIFYNNSNRHEYFTIDFDQVDDKNNVIAFFQHFCGFDKETPEELEELKMLKFKEIGNEVFESNESSKPNEGRKSKDELAPKIGGIIFPLSTRKKHFPFHVECEKYSNDIQEYILAHLNDDQPPHWRNIRDVKQVTKNFIEGDPIEQYRGKTLGEFRRATNITRTPLNRPPGFVQRSYDDFY
uniref:Uncharacterized protein n=1 Tax=Panagrolaimus sp. ES5 TaxID=591445 RepID=A0AC34FB93_9BILA